MSAPLTEVEISELRALLAERRQTPIPVGFGTAFLPAIGYGDWYTKVSTRPYQWDREYVNELAPLRETLGVKWLADADGGPLDPSYPKLVEEFCLWTEINGRKHMTHHAPFAGTVIRLCVESDDIVSLALVGIRVTPADGSAAWWPVPPGLGFPMAQFGPGGSFAEEQQVPIRFDVHARDKITIVAQNADAGCGHILTAGLLIRRAP